MRSVLELCQLTKEFGTFRAVDALELQLREGEFFSLVGPSGCGKTTTLRLIAGFERPTAGRVVLGERDVTALPPYRRDVTTVFQNYALFPHLSVSANVAFGLEQRRTPVPDSRRRVSEALEQVRLSDKADRKPHQLSGGEKQRVALARSLVVRPRLLLLDEPLSALDSQLRSSLRAELKSLQRQVGITFLFITHDQEEALSLSDRMAVMHGGRLQQMGTPRDLYHQPCSRFVAGFLGLVNWLGSFGVRPEAVRMTHDAACQHRHATGVIRGLTFLGSRTRAHVHLDSGEECMADADEQQNRLQPGERVILWWLPSDEIHLPQ